MFHKSCRNNSKIQSAVYTKFSKSSKQLIPACNLIRASHRPTHMRSLQQFSSMLHLCFSFAILICSVLLSSIIYQLKLIFCCFSCYSIHACFAMFYVSLWWNDQTSWDKDSLPVTLWMLHKYSVCSSQPRSSDQNITKDVMQTLLSEISSRRSQLIPLCYRHSYSLTNFGVYLANVRALYVSEWD